MTIVAACKCLVYEEQSKQTYKNKWINYLFYDLREREVVITETSKSVPDLAMNVCQHAQDTCGGNRKVVNAILEQLAQLGRLRSIRGGDRHVNETIRRMKNISP